MSLTHKRLPHAPGHPTRSYEHTNAICNVLKGVPAPKLPTELEDKLKAMFAEIQEPFERNCPPNRKNFLSYGYTLYKFCELLGEVSLGYPWLSMFPFRPTPCAQYLQKHPPFALSAHLTKGSAPRAFSVAEKYGKVVRPRPDMEEDLQGPSMGVHSVGLGVT